MEKTDKSVNQPECPERQRALPSRERPVRSGYWVVGGVVCFTKDQMREAVSGMRDRTGR